MDGEAEQCDGHSITLLCLYYKSIVVLFYFTDPSLRTLCKLAVIQYKLDQTLLPKVLKYENNFFHLRTARFSLRVISINNVVNRWCTLYEIILRCYCESGFNFSRLVQLTIQLFI